MTILHGLAPSDVVLLAPLLAPLLAALLALLFGWRPFVAWSAVVASLAILGSGVVAAILTVDGSAIALAGTLRVDALSAVMLLVIGGVALIATWASVGYMRHELDAGHTNAAGAQQYGVLVPLFLCAMALAVLASNLGVMWAAVEATTIVTAFLVGHRRGRAAVEASWKYVIICSVGIALAYLGTVLVYYASQHADIGFRGTLDWVQLAAHAGQLDPGVMRIAVPLLILGFGTKAGLVPMHSWLPDAHSEAPAPVSALMSGVLLSVAVYALLRYRVIAVAALDLESVRVLLLIVALASIAVAASLLIAQKDYKRLLAYSSIEHMGLATVGVAVGTPLAVAALLLHVLGHGLAKAVLFCASGRILASEGTTKIADVRGLMSRRPTLAGVFAFGLAALLGLPPFSLFASELALARATANAGLFWVVIVAFLLLLVVFIAIAGHVAGMLFGRNVDDPSPPVGRHVGRGALAPLVVGLIALAILGIVAQPLGAVLKAAATIVGTS